MKPGSLHAKIEQTLGILYGITTHTLDAKHIASLGWTVNSYEHRTGISLAIGRRMAYICRWR
ncbi:hypothetical protein ACFVFS_17360 [Kitasatospora sp. NPDC057692]|uniref:hypothetical protein n=1 Tax=Kitasatospora sp. NPDC057692 TaxID=3346215 RepID=UPI003699234B